MKNKQIYYLIPILVFITFLLDTALTSFFNNLLPSSIQVTSFVLLIVAIYLTEFVSSSFLILTYLLIGLLFDIFYTNSIGMATTLFPISILMFYYFYQSLEIKLWLNIVILEVLLFINLFAFYSLARIFAMTSLSIYQLLIYVILPNLLINGLLLCLFHPLFLCLNRSLRAK